MPASETGGLDIRFHTGGVDASELPSSYPRADPVIEQIRSDGFADMFGCIDSSGCIIAGDIAIDGKARRARRQPGATDPTLSTTGRVTKQRARPSTFCVAGPASAQSVHAGEARPCRPPAVLHLPQRVEHRAGINACRPRSSRAVDDGCGKERQNR
jgi:hypothetical protein